LQELEAFEDFIVAGNGNTHDDIGVTVDVLYIHNMRRIVQYGPV
jgi:hypothetical protein